MAKKSDILKLLPDFKKKYFHNWGKQSVPFALQRRALVDLPRKPAGTIDYETNKNGTVNDQLLLSHFGQEIVKGRNYEYSSLAIAGNWEICKWLAIDADSDEQIKATHEKLLPALSGYRIEPLVETSRGGRMHVWIFCHLTPQTAEKFMLQLFSECNEKTSEWEIYPLFHRRDNVIRVPGGYHFKAGKASGVITSEGIKSDAVSIIQAILNAKQYTEEEILARLKFIPQQEEVRRERKKYKPFVYIPRNMEIPVGELPAYLECMGRECQAIRQLLYDSANNEQIEKAGINHHNTLLMFAGLARFVDHITNSSQGTFWFEKMLSKYRSRGVETHGLEFKSNKSPQMGAWRCETIDKYFGLCEGCPYKKRDGFDTPKQLYYGKKIKKIKVEDVD